ncbi:MULTISPECIES: AAA family ATPase [Corallococcus]|uniref:AAA family ATPase n=1 Tax=Corallococcus TaxID=83461 RepID=UPI0011814312|nr:MULTISPECIES: AAA family ATPase [Corallococcus]NBD12915.1 AAA family ATPase [Corallococcus silvisoli]TSC21565.1 AAA family ATPase [Corallococcus sp. Z5C101001]
MKIPIPEQSLVLLIGPSGAGKSTLARAHFPPEDVRSGASNDPALFEDVARRLARGACTVIDGVPLSAESRRRYVTLAREHHVPLVAVVLDTPEALCLERNRSRAGAASSPRALRNQVQQLQSALKGLAKEGLRHVHVLTPEAVDTVAFERRPVPGHLHDERGPFDIIGDIHGCFDELKDLLTKLGYAVEPRPDGARGFDVGGPPGRKAVFLGDLVDRGPGVTDVLRLVMGMVSSGQALCVPGNHEIKLLKKLRGKDVRVGRGLAVTLEQLEREPPDFAREVADFIEHRPTHCVLDGGRLVVAHAGLKERMHGRDSPEARDFALYGETTGEADAYGLPVRADWAEHYRGQAMVVYGHTSVTEAEWVHDTLCLDTGCVFGGKLTALRYPERQLVSVPARRVYWESRKHDAP